MVEAVANKPADVEVKSNSLPVRLSIVSLLVGVGLLIVWASLYAQNHERALYGYLFSFVVTVSLVLGAMIFVLIQHITRAGWSVVVRRIPEAVIATTPLFLLLFLPVAVGMHDIFAWTHKEHLDDILLKKVAYLNEEFFLIRSFGYLILWCLIGLFYYRSSIKQDGDNEEKHTRRMVYFSPVGVILFALSLTFAAFDWIMSLHPHWYSTIFGVYFFAGSFLFALAFITLVALFLQRLGFLKNVITGEHYHDLGKLLFGFTVFWAYISFSQFMLYWYGAIPEEIEFYTHRLHNGWEYVSWLIPVLHFFVPFFCLMSRYLKRVKLVLAFNCFWVIFVHLIDIYWLIIPAFHDKEVVSGPTPFRIISEDLSSLFGMFLVFFAIFLFILCKNKLIPINDPRLKESLKFENF